MKRKISALFKGTSVTDCHFIMENGILNEEKLYPLNFSEHACKNEITVRLSWIVFTNHLIHYVLLYI